MADPLALVENLQKAQRREFGVELFERSPRKVTLTEARNRLLPEARNMLAAAARLKAAASATGHAKSARLRHGG